MFWSLVDPFVYTFVALSTIVAVSTLLAPKFKRKRLGTFFLGVGCSIFLFVPALHLTHRAMNSFRFGLFHYDQHAAIRRPEVSQWLPEGATDITVQQHVGGFEAKYSISEIQLKQWIDTLWATRGDRAALSREKQQEVIYYPNQAEAEAVGWSVADDATVYYSPRAKNWAGFTAWYSESEGVVYQEAGYW